MKLPKLERHYGKVAELKKKLDGKANPFPFDEAASLANLVVQKWLADSPSRFSKESDKGGTYSWSLGGGWNVAHEHCVRYVMYHYSSKGRTLIGLGYDFRHWVLDGNTEQIPWRVWFYDKELPKYVQDKLRDKLLDGFAYDGKHSFFALIPKKYLTGLEQLPIKDEGKYVEKLAKAASKFLDDLYEDP